MGSEEIVITGSRKRDLSNVSWVRDVDVLDGLTFWTPWPELLFFLGKYQTILCALAEFQIGIEKKN